MNKKAPSSPRGKTPKATKTVKTKTPRKGRTSAAEPGAPDASEPTGVEAAEQVERPEGTEPGQVEPLTVTEEFRAFIKPDETNEVVVYEPASGELAMLEARSISAWFGDRKVLDRVSIDMPPGQVTALIGPSGCGKSTFLRILNRMHELVAGASLAGEVRLDGEDIYDPSRRLTDARRAIGMVFQKPNPFPAMSIRDNVLAGLKLTGTKIGTADKDYLVE